MFELKVQSPKDKNVWIQSIRSVRLLFFFQSSLNYENFGYNFRNAVVDCPSFEFELEDALTAEERQRLLEQKHQTMREIISE